MAGRIVAFANVFGLVTLLTTAVSAVDVGAQSRGRSVRVQLSDSSWANVLIDAKDPHIIVYTPQGIFRLNADASTLAAWARAAAALPSPAPDTGAGATAAAARLTGSLLRATDESGNAMRLIRLSGDSGSAYHLAVSNGAWSYGERMAPERASLFLAALAGREATGLKWAEPPVMIESSGPGYRPPQVTPHNPAPKYPTRAELRGQAGEVSAQFTVGPDGWARPETLRIVRSSHPLFALAVRDAIPAMRFAPATRDGMPVEEVVFQRFEFRVP